MKVVIELRAPALDAQGVKEQICMRLEGLAEGIRVTELRTEERQTSLFEGMGGGRA